MASGCLSMKKSAASIVRVSILLSGVVCGGSLWIWGFVRFVLTVATVNLCYVYLFSLCFRWFI